MQRNVNLTVRALLLDAFFVTKSRKRAQTDVKIPFLVYMSISDSSVGK